MICRTSAGVMCRTQPFGKELAQKWPTCRDVHNINGSADFAYVPDEVLH